MVSFVAFGRCDAGPAGLHRHLASDLRTGRAGRSLNAISKPRPRHTEAHRVRGFSMGESCGPGQVRPCLHTLVLVGARSAVRRRPPASGNCRGGSVPRGVSSRVSASRTGPSHRYRSTGGLALASWPGPSNEVPSIRTRLGTEVSTPAAASSGEPLRRLADRGAEAPWQLPVVRARCRPGWPRIGAEARRRGAARQAYTRW